MTPATIRNGHLMSQPALDPPDDAPSSSDEFDSELDDMIRYAKEKLEHGN